MADLTLPQSAHSQRVALYARISTLNHGQDVDLQLRELRDHSLARGWRIAREYVDKGISGAVESRPELNHLMADARKRRFDIVACWRFDRFARSTKHLLLALEEFRSLGIQFVSYQENIDTTSPLGQAVFTIVAAVATLERDLIRDRVRAGLRNARAKGKRLGRPQQWSMPPALLLYGHLERPGVQLPANWDLEKEQFDGRAPKTSFLRVS